MSAKTKTRRLSFNAAVAEADRTGAFAAAAAEKTEAPAPAPKAKTPKTPRWTALDAERVAWIARNARPAVSPCLCGCGETTKGRFFPGHDATLKEALKATRAAGDDGDATIPGTPAAAAAAATDALVAFGWE